MTYDEEDPIHELDKLEEQFDEPVEEHTQPVEEFDESTEEEGLEEPEKFNQVRSDENNNSSEKVHDNSARSSFCQQLLNSSSDPKVELIDELKQIQEVLELKRKADETKEMDILPKSYQIIRQYPILSSKDVLNISEDVSDEEDHPRNGSEFVRNGFGRMSRASMRSVDAGQENNNSVDEITIYGNITRKPVQQRR